MRGVASPQATPPRRVLARTIINCSDALVLYAMDDTAFAPSIWDKFFSLCAHFLTQPCLQLERLSDYRSHSYQQQFVSPSLFPPGSLQPLSLSLVGMAT